MDNAQQVSATISPNISTTKTLKVYSGVAARILSQLSAGANQREAAAACGVTEGFVSQLMAEEDFKAQLKKKFEEATLRAIEIDQNYEEIEHKATEQLRKLIPLLHSPAELLKVALGANSAKRKLAPAVGKPPEDGNGAGRVLKIILPQVIVNNYVVNPNNEVVAVGERTLTTLNSASITGLMNKHKEGLLLEHQKELSQPAILDIPKAKHVTKDKWSDL